MDLVVADESGNDMFALGEFELDMECSTAPDAKNDFELRCSAGLPRAGWRVYADGTEVGGRVEGFRLATERGKRTLTWVGSTWSGVLDRRLLWPDDGDDYLTWSGDANGLLRWAVERLGLGDFFSVPGREAGAGVALKASRDEPSAWANLTRALRASGMRMRAEWSHGACSLSAEPVTDWRDRVDTDLVDFDLTASLLTYNCIVAAGEGELAQRAVARAYADADGNVSAERSLSGALQVDYFHDSPSVAADDIQAEAEDKLRELQGQGSVEVTVRDGWEPGLGDVVTGSDRAFGVSVSAEVTGRVTKATALGAASTYTAEAGAVALGNAAAARAAGRRGA